MIKISELGETTLKMQKRVLNTMLLNLYFLNSGMENNSSDLIGFYEG